MKGKITSSATASDFSIYRSRARFGKVHTSIKSDDCSIITDRHDEHRKERCAKRFSSSKPIKCLTCGVYFRGYKHRYQFECPCCRANIQIERPSRNARKSVYSHLGTGVVDT